ncbi:orotidine-5'-phosphate decarboxylase [Methylomarinovum tepidoasis]|uniref:Orotidine 5'-phosphate decarboxylase n=1 Tax=Methylomarinovum tepidoasis TaxID=2840183 RepID=A0AAU9BXG3_9GAMM|nr:orotidine-5'-phosphate decarboxylase [Methylomarinovum sp. IN45]BCX88153.1 orotidine-5'-phosphate decarboxylase [Methylomarinovum sp. IN45]
MPCKPIPPQDRLIVALDLPDHAQARELVERLGGTATFYKIGLELFMAGDYFALIDWLTARGKKVFADLKFYDIPATVERAVRALSRTPVTFATVHGDPAIMAAAARGKGATLKILAVTVLTSLDEAALKAMGYASDLETLVRRRARQAVDAGLDGVIASGREAQLLRRELGDDPLIVTPGVRPQGSPAGDQKRVVTVEEAFANGADYIVVGRPIRDAHDPKAAAEAIQQQIATLFQN